MSRVLERPAGEALSAVFQVQIDGLEECPGGEESGEAPEYDAGDFSGTRRLDKMVLSATVNCVKADWLVKSKGAWSVAEDGKSASAKFATPEAFYRETVRLYGQWKRGRKSNGGGEAENIDGDASAITFVQAQRQAKAQIEHYLESISSRGFQQIVADLLQAMGYFVSWLAPPGKDGECNVIAYTTRWAKPPRVMTQVKRTKGPIGCDSLKSFLEILSDGDVGIYVTAGGFTAEAEDFCRGRKITLIGLEQLLDLWIQNFSRLEPAARQRLPLTSVYFLTPATDL